MPLLVHVHLDYTFNRKENIKKENFCSFRENSIIFKENNKTGKIKKDDSRNIKKNNLESYVKFGYEKDPLR